MFRSQTTRHSASAALIGIAGLSLLPVPALADDIPAFKFETPEVYVQIGLEVNPDYGLHPLIAPVPAFWDAVPTELTLNTALVVRARGQSTHIIAPHAGETAPSGTWFFNIATTVPINPFGARETRVRGSVGHGAHFDAYEAVVGALVGTKPGPSLEPLMVIIHGSIGRHVGELPPPPSPIIGGGPLEPPSKVPGPGQDYPAGVMISIVNTEQSRLSMLVVVSGLTGGQIGSVFLRHGEGGPIMMDLRPMMQLHTLHTYASALVLGDGSIPPHIVQLIADGQAYISVNIPTSAHPDGQITGAITGKCPADYNNDGFVDGIDYDNFNNDFESTDPQQQMNADYNSDGFVDGIDSDNFNNDFETPCP